MNLVAVVALTFSLTLTAIKANDTICYLGQEPRADSTGLLWYLTVARPTECTVYRWGGFNAQTLLTTLRYSTTIGGDREASNLWASKDERSIYRRRTRPCTSIDTHSGEWFGPYPNQSHFSSSFDQFAFAVETSDHFTVRFSTIIGSKVYIAVSELQSVIYQSSWRAFDEKLAQGVGGQFPGLFWVECGDGKLDVRGDGNQQTSFLHLEDDSGLLRNISHVELSGPAKWQIFSPC
ncbi:uncharacterized protein LOC110978026 [Acanthaster planci]|uniref:Uncharacterized protein LOC110978026 n=1 Tax=Acanthaster planci TaxID=133434 RepID=A0A8B7Y576_ACAPL|nr:uncharacterized protein LOC110978026 [Acanthaster planci]